MVVLISINSKNFYLFLLPLCLVYLIYYFQTLLNTPSSIEVTSKSKRNDHHFDYDVEMANKGENYHTCRQIDKMKELLLEEEKKIVMGSNLNMKSKYRDLHCGRERIGSNIFAKKRYVLWNVDECVKEILSAKIRLLDYMEELCTAQSNAITTTISNTKANNNKNININNYKELGLEMQRKHGIIYTGTTEHLHDIYQSILSHRLLNVTLAVEVWVNQRDMHICMHSVARLVAVRCCELADSVAGFSSKFHSILGSSFTGTPKPNPALSFH